MNKLVKIKKCVDNDSEYFWVVLLNQSESNCQGIVDNELVLDHGFDYGDLIDFSFSDIIEEFAGD